MPKPTKVAAKRKPTKKKRAPLSHYTKAIVAGLAAPLTYVAGQLIAEDPVNPYHVASYVITAILVWALPNKPPA